jgi:transcription elongation factor GreA
MVFDGTQDLSQLGRAELAGSAGSVAISGEADVGHENEIKTVTLVRSMSDTPTFLTPAAHAKLVDELEMLKTEGRHRMAERIAEARSHGDLRENADYDAAKNDQGLMEARIRKLEHLIQTAEVRAVENSGKVEVGMMVTIADADGDETEVFVAPQENKVPGLILASPTSPLGKALLGARVGDEVSYHAPAGTFTVRVESVRPYEP